MAVVCLGRCFPGASGQIRQMGAGKRSREKPHIFPISTAERLWYRALIGRDFIQQDGRLTEVAYVPEELLPWLPEAPKRWARLYLW